MGTIHPSDPGHVMIKISVCTVVHGIEIVSRQSDLVFCREVIVDYDPFSHIQYLIIEYDFSNSCLGIKCKAVPPSDLKSLSAQCCIHGSSILGGRRVVIIDVNYLSWRCVG